MGPNPYESPIGVDDLSADRKRLNEAFFSSGFLYGILPGFLAGCVFCLIVMRLSDWFRELGY